MGLLEVGHGKYIVAIKHNIDVIIDYHDSTCMVYNNYSRDNRCFRFSRVYKKLANHTEIKMDDEIVFTWFDETINGIIIVSKR